MRTILFIFLVSSNLFANTYYPDDYHQKLLKSAASSKKVKILLFELMSLKHIQVKGQNDKLSSTCTGVGRCRQQTSLGYKTARRVLFGKLHLEEDNKGYFVRDVYCEKKITSKQTSIGPDLIPKNSVINCEHTWPQSRFNRNFPLGFQKSDLHHLFPTDSQANSTRGSNEFGEVNGFPLRNCAASHEGAEKMISGRYFEPPANHRGNVARALFYFSVRYKTKIRQVEEEFLRKWHEDDPVDQNELDRNEMIYKVQGNRNPFIDYPEYVDQVDDF